MIIRWQHLLASVPLGVNSITTILPKAAKKAGLQGNFTGHSGKASSDDRVLSQPKWDGSRYDNPWPTWKFPSKWDLMLMMKEFLFSSGPLVPSMTELPVQKPVFRENGEVDEVRATWLGHATVLYSLDGIRVLCDPIFSEYCSPVHFVGPARYRLAPCIVSDLPKLDAVVISHTHYDHLDKQSVKDINRRFPEVQWFVPMGCAKWMESVGCQNVKEMSWWDKKKLNGRSDVEMVFTPTQHWSGRQGIDRNKCLWGSWAVIGPRHRVWFAGDTGYCEAFKEIGKEYGPFDMAAIPIGAYCPRWFMRPQHVDPEEAVKIHNDVRSKCSVGIHWGTFRMTYEPIMEPKSKLLEAVEKILENQDSKFITINHGQTLIYRSQTNHLDME